MRDDQFLYGFQQEPRPAFAGKLFQRLMRAGPARPAVQRRLVWGFFAIGLFLVAFILVSPGARVYAQNLLYQIGHLVLSDAPTYAEQYEAALQAATPTASGSPVVVEWQANPLLTIDEAAAQAGFAVAELTGVPEDMALVTRMVNPPDAQNPYTAVITTYQSAGQTIIFRQLAYLPGVDPQTLPVGEALVKEVQVRGSAGLWLENLRLSTFVDPNNKVAPQYASLLRWSEAAFEFELMANPGLALDEMLQMAKVMVIK